jgi:hypothetical protein
VVGQENLLTLLLLEFWCSSSVRNISLPYSVSVGIKWHCQNTDEGSILETQPELSHLNEREQVFLSQYQGVTQVWCLFFLDSYAIHRDFPKPDTPLFKQRLRSLANRLKVSGSLVLSNRAKRRLKVDIRGLYGRRLWRQTDEQQLTLWAEKVPLSKMLSESDLPGILDEFLKERQLEPLPEKQRHRLIQRLQSLGETRLQQRVVSACQMQAKPNWMSG